MNKKTIKDIDLKEKKVFVRCDFNVPMGEDGNITDNTRIVAAIPTIKYLLEQNCKIVLCSHLGRPKGEFKPEFSLAPVAKELSNKLSKDVKKDLKFELIFMTYSYVHRMINKEAFPNAINLYNTELMTVRGRGRYMYRKEIKIEAEIFFRNKIKKYFPENEILYIV